MWRGHGRYPGSARIPGRRRWRPPRVAERTYGDAGALQGNKMRPRAYMCVARVPGRRRDGPAAQACAVQAERRRCPGRVWGTGVRHG